MNIELQEDLQREAKEEAMHEKKMHNDLDYALQHTDFKEAIEMLQGVVKVLDNYGYELSLKDLIEIY